MATLHTLPFTNYTFSIKRIPFSLSFSEKNKLLFLISMPLDFIKTISKEPIFVVQRGQFVLASKTFQILLAFSF